MKDQRSTTGKQRYPGFNGRIIVDTWRGKQRVRAWPRKSGPPKSLAVRQQNAWFKAANRMAKLADPGQIKLSMELVRNSGLYPRDLIVRSMGQGFFDLVEMDGSLIQYRQDRIDPVSFQGVILRPSGSVSCPIGVATYLTWTLPVRDDASLWDISNPTRITVPTGVTIMNFHAGAVLNSSATTYMIAHITTNRTTTKGYTRVGNSARVSQTLSTGPCLVTPGDYFEANVQIGAVGSLLGGGRTYFCGEVLEYADP